MSGSRRLPRSASADWRPADGRPDRPEGPARLKLTELVAGEARRAPVEEEDETILREDFSRGLDGWRAASNAERPLEGNTGTLGVHTQEGEPGLKLSSSGGVLYRVVPVEPATCYEFSARVLARGLEPTAVPFFGATTYLAELTRIGSPEELFGRGVDAHIHRRHLFDSVHGEEGEVELRRLLRTGAETRALLVSMVLGFGSEDLAPGQGGALWFHDVRLVRRPMHAFWEARAAEALADFAVGAGELGGWRAERLVRGLLGAEVRPSILCLPGDTVRFRLPVPHGESPRLETGVGPWERALLPGADGTQAFVLRVDGAEAWRLEPPPAGSLGSARWRDERIDLGPWAGREVELELSVEGGMPGLFGAPQLVAGGRGEAGPNLLLISIDTLRADHLGCYGAGGDPTPNLDRLASEGVRFAEMTGQAPYTLPGHASMLSGQFPRCTACNARPRRCRWSARRCWLASWAPRATAPRPSPAAAS